MSTIIDQLEKIIEFCRVRSISPQAIEVCQRLGSHIRIAPADFDDLPLKNATHTVFGGDNPWLLKVGFIDDIEIRSHDSIDSEILASTLGQQPYIVAQTFDARFASALTATIDLQPAQKDIDYA